MEAQAFHVLKKTGTLADATAAAGLGVLLQRLTGANPLIRDRGAYLEVRLDEPVDLGSLPYHVLTADPGYPYVAKPGDPDAPAHGEVIDYAAERAKLGAAREARAAQRARAKLDAGTEAGETASGPRPDWYLYQELNVLQAFTSYNRLHAAIRGADPEVLAESVRLKLEASARGRDPAEAETEFAFRVSPVQGFNPVVGKGVNRTKPTGAPVTSLSDNYADWFEEWLRYAGAAIVAYAAPVGKDIKFMALAPAEIRLNALMRAVRPKFIAAAGRVWTSSQLDVCCVLAVAERLIKGSGLLEGDPEWRLVGYTPRDVIGGIHTAYFKSLGTGRAVSNLSFIGLPGWFPVSDASSARDWLEIIDEHLGVVRFLREDRAEEYALITAYRDFLSGNDVLAFLRFTAMYAPFVLGARAANRPVRQLTTTNLGKVVENMESSYSCILGSEGFRNIARAIRRATVSAQFQAGRGGQVYEIHYGLFHDLRRSAGFKDRLVQVVGDFVCSYNAENARAAERAGQRGDKAARSRRPQVTTSDLEEFVGLVEEFGPETVAYLLIAYGSAREPREVEPDEAKEAGA